jgi:dolichol-phosphate mannosyltransferase
MGSTAKPAAAQPSDGIYPGHRVLAMFPFYNERDKLLQFIPKIKPGLVDKFLPVDDASTDEGAQVLRQHGLDMLHQLKRSGVGACIKRAVTYAQENGFDIIVVMAGNNKDDPSEIPQLLKPIVENGMDYVQGSRFMPGGVSPNLPIFRRITIKMLSLFFWLYSRRKCTDLTNGFRAYRIAIFDDPRINIWQEWLDAYEYEFYVHWKVYNLGYRVTEVPVTKTYPSQKGVRYTKIRPITGWYRMLRPFVLLALGIKK